MITSLVPILPFLIPICAIVMSLSIPIVAIIVDYNKRRRIYELHHKERLAAIEKGMEPPPLPPDLLGGGRRRRPRPLLWGLIWLFGGIALTAALVAEDGWREGLYGLIPTGVGLAFLIYYAVEGAKLSADWEREQDQMAKQSQ